MEYYPLIKELPATERPRERLKQYGAASLSNSELVAIILRTGAASDSVLNLSASILCYAVSLTLSERTPSTANRPPLQSHDEIPFFASSAPSAVVRSLRHFPLDSMKHYRAVVG